MIVLSGVRFAYPGRPPVLEGCSLRAAGGEVLALAGPNGAGKSTLLKLAAGLLKPEAGEVSLDDRPVLEWRKNERAKRLAYVPQNPVAPQDWPVHALVELGDHPHREAPPAPRALAQRLRDARSAMDLEEIWDREARTLSGGEGQRVVLARVLVQDAPNLVLDEPASHLDLSHQLALFQSLRGLASQGRAVLLTTHDLNLSMLFGQRLVLMDRSGRLRPFPQPPEEQGRALGAVFGVDFVPVEVRGVVCWFPRGASEE